MLSFCSWLALALVPGVIQSQLGLQQGQQQQQRQQKVLDDLLPLGGDLGDQGSDFGANLEGCESACAMLSALVPREVTAQGTTGYQPLAYWSVQQAEAVPACRVDVTSAESIAITIKVSRQTKCPFVVKSGGHAAFAGGSSIQKGILINLKALNMVELSEDRSTASVGPGNTWHDVYSKLDPLKVSVVGGREAGVGVGGLILGGGISYFSGKYGWACDNVRNYEVVLADGTIVNASPTSNPDLYWALRGGSGTNFGIVSRFDLAAFDQGPMWGGSRYYSMSTNSSLANAFANFNDAAPTDPSAHLYIAFVHAQGNYIAVSGPAHSDPVPNPPIFDELGTIPHLVDATSVASISTLSVELNQTVHLREIFRTVTFKNSAPLIKKITDIFVQEVSPLVAAPNTAVPGLIPAFAFQPISLTTISRMSQNGGNALGLTPTTPAAPTDDDNNDGPLMIMNLNFGWANAADDDVVHAATKRFLDRSVALAEEMQLNHRFVYMNYATLDQDVFAGYGEENHERLKSVREKYDPEGVFRRLQPGYFKL